MIYRRVRLLEGSKVASNRSTIYQLASCQRLLKQRRRRRLANTLPLLPASFLLLEHIVRCEACCDFRGAVLGSRERGLRQVLTHSSPPLEPYWHGVTSTVCRLSVDILWSTVKAGLQEIGRLYIRLHITWTSKHGYLKHSARSQLGKFCDRTH